MAEVEEELEVVYCYCCEDFTPHEVYEYVDGTIYVCECGCESDSSEDEIIRPDGK